MTKNEQIAHIRNLLQTDLSNIPTSVILKALALELRVGVDADTRLLEVAGTILSAAEILDVYGD
jgi:hypothetical protein